ncbi:MAG TPA: tRNA (adenosine(37)-N6)-threonylcarbamoyltransferase complex ATPase subunit type 1 TsaE [Accumulibacter sp.]|uniref:tRNA (adenosine(37)-N6)-threonylcarbamoyltransferase complex ATPase subunit type 1 TsaE n=3 Tax=Accumulibacter sp. TaxID=2053492 RepID=UPI002C3F0D96|nr:tRNA (adenosine(37)-N6)-threonylcarbamoyltransferase complex ATPase subunit type 1 TsaE [Accumulibacter sp.]HMV06585.1 tRNA (adenosine(37)-N6)-threonylcarbamoyltransferase complex ATPase subunit type 1 TsaE [Accumulibacter sp.]HNG15958.1 tRNA (adenosine(37)-N6)-threonylcarbamoyltransferase complex ATPase subunit type 1 TsaE [Accumulibacter sp.]HNG87644.1 tRNA (adenosine(37)-N6)-threonylcarbamoyltransferase complex ATPase subunit type 1 TsaE [Accumulibacter sp.]HNH91791.1 tRNA (adenosine(37)-
MHSPDHTQCTLRLQLPDETATANLGGQLAPLLFPGMVVWLEGGLGVGKTTLVRALLRALGHRGSVRSPTYTLVEIYVISRIYWYHFDFYRFNLPEEFVDAGLGEYFRGDCVCLVEWPQKAVGYVPPADLAVLLQMAENGRVGEVVAYSEEGKRCLSELRSHWPVVAN